MTISHFSESIDTAIWWVVSVLAFVIPLDVEKQVGWSPYGDHRNRDPEARLVEIGRDPSGGDHRQHG